MNMLLVRQRLGLSQAELGKKLGVQAPMISGMERGDKKPSYEVLKKLFELGATVEELFGVNYKPDKPPPEALDLEPEKAWAVVEAGLRFKLGM